MVLGNIHSKKKGAQRLIRSNLEIVREPLPGPLQEEDPLPELSCGQHVQKNHLEHTSKWQQNYLCLRQILWKLTSQFRRTKRIGKQTYYPISHPLVP